MTDSSTPGAGSAPDLKPMTEDELRAIRERERVATPGPWVALLKSIGMTGVHSREPEHDCRIYHALFDTDCLPETHERQKADAAFIAAARADIPRLLAEIDRLRGALSGQRTEGDPLREAVAIAEKRHEFCREKVAATAQYDRLHWEARQEEAWIISRQLMALRSSQGGAASTPEGKR